MQKLGRKVLNETTIIVYTKSPDKIKQYEDLYVQTFFLNKLDAKKAVNLIRTMLQVKKIYVNEEMNTLVIRDTFDVIEVARRILEANDVPDAEVVLEVEVIELSKKNAESFGLALSKYAVGMKLTGPSGQFLSDSFATTDSVTTAANVTTPGGNAGAVTGTITRANTDQLVNLFRWGDYNSYITVPSATFNFGKTLGNAETLSNPKIRVKNREKAKFNVGTRVPITTTSSNGVGNYNVNVQYVDVGVKLNAEPTIQLNNDVNIKLSLEVSSILSKERVGTDGNTTVATIGTRNMDTVLSLKDGETSVIGGLIQDTKGQNTQKVWFLGDIPILSQLFSNHDNTGDKTELILAITPRIVRGITVSDPEIAAFWSGLEDDPNVSRGYASFIQEPEFAKAPDLAKTPDLAPVPGKSDPAAPMPQGRRSRSPMLPPAAQQQSLAPVPQPSTLGPPDLQAAAPAPAVIPVPAEPVVDVPPVTLPSVPGTAAKPSVGAAVVAVPPAAPQKKVSIRVSAPAAVKQGEQFAAEIFAADADGLTSAPLTVVFDPVFIEVITVAEGELFKNDGKSATFTYKIDNKVGQVSVTLLRDAASGGVRGSGRLFTMNVRAKSPGAASIGFIGGKLQFQGGTQLDATLYNAVVEVRKP
jgi:general secretion pathway protein D